MSVINTDTRGPDAIGPKAEIRKTLLREFPSLMGATDTQDEQMRRIAQLFTELSLAYQRYL